MADVYAHPRREVILAKKQAQKIKDVARYVLFVNEKGNFESGKENNPHGVNVFAVIGPVKIGGIQIKEALLCEVGRKRGRPYNAACRTPTDLNGLSSPVHCSARRHYLKNKDLFAVRNIWSMLQEAMVRDASLQLRDWADPRYIERYNRSFCKGIVYSVSMADPYFLASVLQTEILHRSTPNSLEDDMRKAASWLSKKLCSYDHLEFADEKELGKEINKKGSDLEAVVEYLYRRSFLPHQLFLLERHMKERGAWGLCKRLLERERVNWNEVSRWGETLDQKGALPFSNACIFCRNVFTRKRERKKKDSYRFQDYLQFFLTPRNKVNPERENVVFGEGILHYPPVIPDASLPDPLVPF